MVVDYNTDKLAELLHLLGCELTHSERVEDTLHREDNICYWYSENALPEAEQHSRNKWRREAVELCAKYSLTPQDMIRFLYQYIDLRKKVEELKSRYNPILVRDLAPLLLKGVIY